MAPLRGVLLPLIIFLFIFNSFNGPRIVKLKSYCYFFCEAKVFYFARTCGTLWAVGSSGQSPSDLCCNDVRHGTLRCVDAMDPMTT